MSCSLTAAHTHPLDQLSASELLAARSVLINASIISPTDAVVSILEVDEPEKSVVKAWKPGQELPSRKALAVTRKDGIMRKTIVNLDKEMVESSEVHEGAGGTALSELEVEVVRVRRILAEYQPLQESLAKRGLSYSETALLPLSPGWFDVSEDEGKRLIFMQFNYANGTENHFMRPISGLFAVIDMDEERVSKYVDDYDEDIPLPRREGTDYRLECQEPPLLKPLNIISTEQPNGPSFTVDRHIVQWGSYWRFHLRMDGRAGTVISMAEVFDDGVWRSVLYKGYLSEMFVPYQDPSDLWYFRTYMDEGEYGLGANASPLEPLNDCPRNAHFLDVVLPSASGLPVVKSNRICIFERSAGDVTWRHTETLAPDGKIITEARSKVTLVVRMVTTLGNYDYLLDWEFQTDGLIRVGVGLTGIIQPKATKRRSLNDEGELSDSLHGAFVSENLVGVIHDHFMTYHLDLDIDGPKNSFVESKLKRRYIPPGAGIRRKSYWDTESRVAQTEADARIQLSLTQPSEFFVINPEKTTRLGNPVGYRLVPSATAATLLDPDDPPQIRADFIKKQIWATQYHKEEKYAGGEFVYQSHGDDTLSVWSNKNRNIANEDIVLWYTIGFHHVPVQEDFPIMSTISGSFELKPANFFENNPVLKMQPSSAADFSAYFPEIDTKIEQKST
ncbi:hypothetical protein R1sor_025910 [Riccia sorocarpa]|uniref:Amine oxidase n=1 Tax=Riccia sorocarpa TaxID=122646 RepID=A0ABD3G9X3_9MARC